LGALADIFDAHGLTYEYVDFFATPEARPILDGVAGLGVLGGPMNGDEND